MTIKHRIHVLANAFVGILGAEIVEKRTNRDSMEGVLQEAKRLGLDPKTVIDVGVANGTFELYRTFPDARHFLVEPLKEFKSSLDRLVQRLPTAEYVIAAAAGKSGESVLNVHPDLDGSSFYLENEDSDVNGAPRKVPTITLDEACNERGLDGPYLIKVDVQGAELDVLAGSERILQATKMVLLEATPFGSMVNGPQLYDIVTFMHDRGFVVFDNFSPSYRPLDGALCQIDISFVKDTGPFRQQHFFATREQREALNRASQKAKSPGEQS